MQDILSMITKLNRPKLLVRAARFGCAGYNRDKILRRLLAHSTQPIPGDAAMQLLLLEFEINEKRRTHAAEYGVAQHIEILTALMGEARLLAA